MSVAAGIELTSAIIDLGTFVYKVSKRLNEFRSAARRVPRTFDDAAAQINLLQQILDDIQDKAGNEFSGAHHSLQEVIASCQAQVSDFDKILIKSIPTADDTRWRHVKKAFISVRQDKAVREVLQNLQSCIGILALYQSNQLLAKSTPLPLPNKKPIWTVPFARDLQFIGREEYIRRIDESLSTHSAIAISGFGGVGKSQIAIEYCYRFRLQHREGVVLWIHAGTVQRVEEAFTGILKEAQPLGWDDPKANKFALVQSWLRDYETPWLMVVDNADDRKIFFEEAAVLKEFSGSHRLADYICCYDRGKTLITTRDREVGTTLTGAPPIEVAAFSTEEASSYLASKLQNESEEDRAALSESLDHIPLAISQAAAYMNANSLTILQYLTLLSSDDNAKILEREIGDLRRDREGVNSISKTMAISFQYLDDHVPRAAEILALMACFDRQGIPEDLLSKDEENIISFEDAIGRLRAFSLIIAERSGRMWQMHRLVQIAVRQWLKASGKLSEWETQALLRVSKRYPSEPAFENWARCDALAPHALAVQGYTHGSKEAEVAYARLLFLTALYSQGRGRHRLAIQEFQNSSEIYERLEGIDKSRKMQIELGIAVCYGDLYNWDKAISILIPLSKKAEEELGATDWVTVRSKSELGSFWAKQGEYTNAAQLLEKTVKDLKDSNATERADTLTLMSELVRVYRDQEQFDSANTLLSEIIAKSKEIQGEESSETLECLELQAKILSRQDRDEESEQVNRDIIRIKVRTLGRNHPETLRSMHMLGIDLGNLGKDNEAIEIFEEAIKAARDVLGEIHPQTLQSMRNLSSLYARKGRFAESIALLHEILESGRSTWPLDHPQRATTVLVLREVKEAQEREATGRN